MNIEANPNATNSEMDDDCSDVELKEYIDNHDEDLYDELVDNATYIAEKDAASYT